jgi:hypothetical protein
MPRFTINSLDRSRALDEMLRQAIADARQCQDSLLQQEAITWLWVCCPDVADELSLPRPKALKNGHLTVDYARRYAA